MPFCTLKPSWYLRSGRLMRTVVTGGQLTMFSFTCVWFFRPCGAGTGGPVGLRCRWEGEPVAGQSPGSWGTEPGRPLSSLESLCAWIQASH